MNVIKVSINYLPGGVGAISPIDSKERMRRVTLKLTLEELRLLATLASDQLFRRQFIDPKMPGFRTDSEEMNLGKALVARLRLVLHEGHDGKNLP
jgi:hypothetical protein